MEEWRDIEGFPGYSVSSCGRVSSRKDYRGRITEREHILKPRVNPNGYEVVTLYNGSEKPRQMSVHRLVAKTFMPIDDESLVVDHLNDDKRCNRLTNLQWTTGPKNSRRAYESGLYEPVFEKTRRPVLMTDLRTNEELYFESVNEAARKLGFSPAIISRAANMLCDHVGHYSVEFAGPEERLLYTHQY